MIDAASSQSTFIAIIALLGAGAAASLAFNKNDGAANLAAHIPAFFASFIGLAFSIGALLSGKTLDFAAESSFPGMSLSFHIDSLSQLFILIISLVALLCTIYGAGYVKHYYGKYNIGTLGFFYNLFIAGMLLVVTSGNALFFVVVWEGMSLASYFLVVFENDKSSSIKAGAFYFVMARLGTCFILLSFLLLYKATGTLEFSAIKAGAGAIPPLTRNIIFLAALAGFGVKAGIIPLHIWLPGAHPAAPSHVSALMSGVMIKTGIYMFARIFFDILPHAPAWWGIVIMTCGAVSSLLGVLYALSEHDIKRLLAFSSIENIGIILLGLGSALIFVSAGLKSLAMVGIIAALYHTLNHAVFKSLLFLSAGAVISETHTRNMEEYGGLIKRMPGTALYFLMGAMAISALPPLNGFFSEWMTFQSLFSGTSTFGPLVKTFFVLSAGALAFTGGLAAACFVKAFGATFLARPRSTEAAAAKESGLLLQLPMAVLSAFTLLLGFFSGSVSRVLLNVASGLGCFKGSAVSHAIALNAAGVATPISSLSIPGVLLAIFVALVSAVVFAGTVSRRQKLKRGITWDCGSDLTPRMEITATGFSRSIITVFKGVFRPSLQSETEYHDSSLRYFPKMTSTDIKVQDLYRSHLYKPLNEALLFVSNQMKKIQSGNINAYILYIFITLIGLLLILGPPIK